MDRLHASPLVDGHVHDDRSLLHIPQHLPGNQFGRPGAGHQHGPDQEIGRIDQLLQIVGVGHHGLHVGRHDLLQATHDRQIDVQKVDAGPHARGDARGVLSDHARPEYDNVGRRHPWKSPQQHPSPALRGLKIFGSFLNRHPTGDLAHRDEQGKRPILGLDRLVSDGNRPGLHESPGQLLAGREVEVGENGLPFAEHLQFLRLRFLDLDDHLRPGEDLLRSFHPFRAGLQVFLIHDSRALAAALLKQDLVAGIAQSPCTDRQQSHPLFVLLDLLGDADDHNTTPPCP